MILLRHVAAMARSVGWYTIRSGRWWVPALAVVCLLRVPLLVMTPLATTNTYSIQYQLGQFLGESYRGRGVAVNDLGYVTWFHAGPVVDIIGLGSFEVLQAKRDENLDADRIAAWVCSGNVSLGFGFLIHQDLPAARGSVP